MKCTVTGYEVQTRNTVNGVVTAVYGVRWNDHFVRAANIELLRCFVHLKVIKMCFLTKL